MLSLGWVRAALVDAPALMVALASKVTSPTQEEGAIVYQKGWLGTIHGVQSFF